MDRIKFVFKYVFFCSRKWQSNQRVMHLWLCPGSKSRWLCETFANNCVWLVDYGHIRTYSVITLAVPQFEGFHRDAVVGPSWIDEKKQEWASHHQWKTRREVAEFLFLIKIRSISSDFRWFFSAIQPYQTGINQFPSTQADFKSSN